METNEYKESSIPLLKQKVESIEKHLDRLGESHRELMAKATELIVVVRMDGVNIANNIRKIDKNHQTLVNRIWALLAAVIISLILSGLEFVRKQKY